MKCEAIRVSREIRMKIQGSGDLYERIIERTGETVSAGSQT